MKGIIDRFEGDLAVIETDDRKVLTVKRQLLPAGAQEGDVIITDQGDYRIDVEETKQRKKEIDVLTRDLWK